MAAMTTYALNPDSLAVHAGREDLAELGVHAPPIDLSSTNPLPDIESGGLSYESMAGGGHPLAAGGFVYQRLWNPTVARYESALAQLEHTPEAVAFSSGMAAITATVLAATQRGAGRHVVAVRPLYGGTDHLLGSGLLDVETTFCHADEIADSLRDDTCLVILETPGNPTLDLVDIRAAVAAAGGVPVAVDNTFATPVLQNPADLGADAGDPQRDQVPRGSRRRDRRGGRDLHRLGRGDPARAQRDRGPDAPARGLPAAPGSPDPSGARARAAGPCGEARRLAQSATLRWTGSTTRGSPSATRSTSWARRCAGPGAMIALELAGGFEAAVRIDRPGASCSPTRSHWAGSTP